jgi:MFS family permease
LVIFAIWVPFGHSLPGIYIFSALFGVLSGAYTNVSPTCIAQISTPEEMGARLGACYSVVSFGCLISVPLSGELLLVVGPQNLIIILGALMVIPLIFCNIARWACLGYRWCWREKV